MDIVFSFVSKENNVLSRTITKKLSAKQTLFIRSLITTIDASSSVVSKISQALKKIVFLG